MDKRSITVLVAEDFEPFRQFLCGSVQSVPGAQLIGETSDGLDAVQKAQQLQPELILLDIGLPSLNGIEAARRIRKVAPHSRILFVSQQSSAVLVEAALAAGGCGYVVKADAGSELMKAIDAVLRGQTFVGNRFAAEDFARPGKKDRKGFPGDEAFASVPLRGRDVQVSHEACFCHHDTGLVDSLAQFTGAALKGGNAAIVLATQSHRDALVPILKANGVDIATALEEGRYIPVDAADALSRFVVNGLPIPDKFMNTAGDLMTRAAKSLGRRGDLHIAACGEAAPLLLAQGNAEGAIWLEQLWHQVAERFRVEILCGYPQASMVSEQHGAHVFQRLCDTHSAAHSR